MLGLKYTNTAARNPEGNSIADKDRGMMKCDYFSIIPTPDGLTAVHKVVESFEHDNE